MCRYRDRGNRAAGPDLDVCPHKIGFSIARMWYNYQIEAETVLMFPKVSSVYFFVRCREDCFQRYLKFSG